MNVTRVRAAQGSVTPSGVLETFSVHSTTPKQPLYLGHVPIDPLKVARRVTFNIVDNFEHRQQVIVLEAICCPIARRVFEVRLG